MESIGFAFQDLWQRLQQLQPSRKTSKGVFMDASFKDASFKDALFKNASNRDCPYGSPMEALLTSMPEARGEALFRHAMSVARPPMSRRCRGDRPWYSMVWYSIV